MSAGAMSEQREGKRSEERGRGGRERRERDGHESDREEDVEHAAAIPVRVRLQVFKFCVRLQCTPCAPKERRGERRKRG